MWRSRQRLEPHCQSPCSSPWSPTNSGPWASLFPLLLRVPFLTLLGPHCLPYSSSHVSGLFLLSVASSFFHPFPVSCIGFILCLHDPPFDILMDPSFIYFSLCSEVTFSTTIIKIPPPPPPHTHTSFLFLFLCLYSALFPNSIAIIIF